jgi:hypothetical protein
MFIMVLLPGIPTRTGHKFGFGAVGDRISILDIAVFQIRIFDTGEVRR